MNHCKRMWVICAVLILWIAPVHAQELERLYAATLRIIHSGVEVRLVNTQRWIPLPVGAETPLGEGDSVRTDLTGRAIVQFGTAKALVLPATQYTIGFYDETGANVTVMGRSIAAIPADSIRYSVSGFMNIMTNRTTDALFAVSTRPAASLPVLAPLNERPPVIYAISASDGVEIVHPDGAVLLPFGQGFAIDGRDSAFSPISLSAPMRFSDLEIATSPAVCDATAIPTLAPRLLARIGAGEAYRSMGGIEYGEPLRIVGKTERGDRYRIAYFSTFAWVVAHGVQLDPACDVNTLPIYSYDTVELPLGMVAVTPEELELLQPFYGTPNDDPWFYRATNDLTPYN